MRKTEGRSRTTDPNSGLCLQFSGESQTGRRGSVRTQRICRAYLFLYQSFPSYFAILFLLTCTELTFLLFLVVDAMLLSLLFSLYLYLSISCLLRRQRREGRRRRRRLSSVITPFLSLPPLLLFHSVARGAAKDPKVLPHFFPFKVLFIGLLGLATKVVSLSL